MKRLICVAGMPGSGKSVVADAARSLGIPVVTMGDVIRAEARRRGLPLERHVLARIAAELREKEGPAAVARRCLELIDSLSSDVVLIDGLRSMFEYETFVSHCAEAKLIFVHASPGIRYRRLVARGREDDPKRWEDFVLRDLQEVSFGLPALWLAADYVLVNEGKALSEVRAEALRVLRGWLGCPST